MSATLPTGSQERKDIPLVRGLLDYFPAALAAVAEGSRVGNDKHNPGEPMHHARGKSMDHADCILRHLVDRGGTDDTGVRHSTWVAWRALALLQEELEANGAPLPRGARLPERGETVEDIQKKIAEWPSIFDETAEVLKARNAYHSARIAAKYAFGVETDPTGKKYRRTGERRVVREGEHYLTESCGTVGRVNRSGREDAWFTRTIVTLVEDDDAPEYPIGSVHHFERDGTPPDSNAGEWLIVDYRVPEPGEKYVYTDEGDAEVNTAQCYPVTDTQRPRTDVHPIVVPAVPIETETQGNGYSFRRTGEVREPRTGEWYLNPCSLSRGRLLLRQWRADDAAGAFDDGRVIVERVD